MPLACHRMAPEGFCGGVEAVQSHYGTQPQVRKYASLCNYWASTGGRTSHKAMCINILRLVSFWN
jgi:hypothetical protein